MKTMIRVLRSGQKIDWILWYLRQHMGGKGAWIKQYKSRWKNLTKEERERKSLFVYLSNSYPGCDWVEPKWGTQNTTQVSHMPGAHPPEPALLLAGSVWTGSWIMNQRLGMWVWSQRGQLHATNRLLKTKCGCSWVMTNPAARGFYTHSKDLFNRLPVELIRNNGSGESQAEPWMTEGCAILTAFPRFLSHREQKLSYTKVEPGNPYVPKVQLCLKALDISY